MRAVPCRAVVGAACVWGGGGKARGEARGVACHECAERGLPLLPLPLPLLSLMPLTLLPLLLLFRR